MFKKIFFIVLVLLVIQKFDVIRSFFNPPPDYAARDVEVVLYSTSWCGYCTKVRELMEKHNVEYYEYDIEKSSEGRKQFESLGGRGVPVVVINGEVIKGYNASEILRLIGET